jgi:hypothetical protein
MRWWIRLRIEEASAAFLKKKNQKLLLVLARAGETGAGQIFDGGDVRGRDLFRIRINKFVELNGSCDYSFAEKT